MESALVSNLSNTCLLYSRWHSKRRMGNLDMLYPRNFNFPQLFAHSNLPKEVSEEFIWPSPADEMPFWKNKFPSRDASIEVPTDIENDSNLIHIIHVTAEMAPIAKVGGLGDVVTGLARACLSRGHAVDIMLPFYECIQKQQINDLALITAYVTFYDGNWVPTKAYRGVVSGVPVIFIEPSNEFFKGQYVYGGSYNELEAYLFFSRACLEWMQVTGVQPDIIHVHEWQTGALPLLYWDMYQNLSLKKPRVVFTIHNMEHYGECRKDQLSKCGLDGSIYASVDKILLNRALLLLTSLIGIALNSQGYILCHTNNFPRKAIDDRTIGHNPERLSLLKGGVVYSNAVVTVSPTYLKETLCSGWLASTLLRNREKYFGILNGIDTVIWDPATDVFLPAKFHARKPEGKKICKYYVQRGLGLVLEGTLAGDPVPYITHNVPLIVCITRLVAQKGLHLITQAIKHTAELGGQMIVLGTASDARVQREFEDLANSVIYLRMIERVLPANGIKGLAVGKKKIIVSYLQVANDTKIFSTGAEEKVDNLLIVHNQGSSTRILLMYSEELSHMLYAAADMVLIPSIYEPCGLAQMIGMRYGAVPVVRKTGGLADTVFDMDDSTNHEIANGFVFEGIDEGSLNCALDRAFRHYREKPDEWNSMVQKVMEIDNSWNNTASKYIEIYNSIRVRW
ncbi:hypothetical protein JRO89_XS04G0264000 [Xanthoceras sorbifolium]|uniref:starch synthase n=1 Tax=Xanthoceras sorbifolium TaxID=99658 RepID=A0ABQ8I791_9ROSI|nr:hypothetical protein JRO89_XS04G0264000 [Xanthoceras sorbifolium]